MSIEVEVKLDAPVGFVLPAFEGFEADAADEVVLQARYWDTSDLRLLAWGHTVRHRSSSDGREDGWTVKVAARDATRDATRDAAPGMNGATRRDELEIPGDELLPPPLVEAWARPYLRGEQLRPVADITTRRERVRLRDPRGNVVEVATDHVDSTAEGVPGPQLHEIEVELIEGDEDALDAVVARLRSSGLVPAPSTSKLAAVLGAYGAPPTHPLPLPRLGRSTTVAELVQAALSNGTGRLLAHAGGVQLGDDPEDVHQARVATRRLRADLQTLAPLLERAAVDGVRGELRWLGGALGAVRDLDVLAGALGQAASEVGADGGATGRLVARVHEERRRSAVELRDVLAADRYVALVARLMTMAHEPPLNGGSDPDARTREVARELAATAWRRVPRAVGHLGDDPPDEALHELRRRVKRARYAYELVAPVAGHRRATTALAQRLAALQGVLGDLQDAVVAQRWLQRSVGTRSRPDEAYVAGLLAAHYDGVRRDSRARWRSSWRKVTRARAGG